MLATASARVSSSSLYSLWQPHMVLNEATRAPQSWVPQMNGLRLGLVPGLPRVRLGTMLLWGMIFLPSIYMELVHYASYEKVIPESLTVEGSEKPGEKASYILFTQGQKQLVHLHVKRDYFVNDFPVYSYHNGVLGQEMLFISRNCYYEGYIDGVPGSFVSVNTCSGLRGILVKGETSYSIEPILSSKRFEHALYTMAHGAHVSCSVTSKGGQGMSTSRQQGSRKLHNPQALSYLWSHTKYVEMFVVVDNQRFQMWGRNVSETVQRVMDIIALVNSFTRGINTEVVLAGMEIWTEGDLTEVAEDLQVTLRNFNSWRREKLVHRVRHDVAHMIVGRHPGENTGQAFLNGACSSGFAAAVESFHHEDVLLFAALMAHELGHNLGIQHDHSACTCKNQPFCLMGENITKESSFSNCSSDDFYRFLREHRGACLFNKPWHRSRMRRDGNCGNGVVDSGEQCDCGSACAHSKCCDSECKLKAPAACDIGPCCVDCKPASLGQLCRRPAGPCDLPEYCDGASPVCPQNRHKQDGTVCHESFGCVSGECMDPNLQCTSTFGFPAKSAPEECYMALNGKGDRFGNCGHPSSPQEAYTKCTSDNKLCGKLVCTGLTSIPVLKEHFTVIQAPIGNGWCWSMDAYSGSDIADIGDVRADTYCAPSKNCKSSECSDVSLDHLNCKDDTTCHGNGICNDLGHCHCNKGYGPPDCNVVGDGGSIDSGPPGSAPAHPPSGGGGQNTTTKQEETVNLTILIIIILIALIIIAIIICFLCLFKSQISGKKEGEGNNYPLDEDNCL
ncbi:disintegrin and metalloproteinase domain-containing protein 1a-like [Lepus europaeus]|uniref:disintegrin and metalloproteinase domain-containing protein 1a-like n=1 Tax=Lepus europaeus TaxID=9983 RepID=UPI002B463246|nr:disintegrin and metalloproteinase domain-containing protein 1a-like [Lepus europaeus]